MTSMASRGEVQLAMTTNEWMRMYEGGCLYLYFCVILIFFIMFISVF